MKKPYVAALAIAAAIILVAGALIRPHMERPKPQEQAAPQPQPVRGSDVRQISDFLSERARRVEQHVIHVEATEASGVIWTGAQAVTVAPAPAIVQMVPATGAPVRLAAAQAPQHTGWMVVVARNSEGESISTAGMLGGSAEAQCGPARVRKLLFNVPLDSAFAGGGVFDVSGALLGVVVQCSGSWTAVTHASVDALLHQQLGASAVAWQDFGIRLREPTDAERKFLRVPKQGLFVGDVRRSSPAASIGILPGDVLISSSGDALERPEDLLVLSDHITLSRSGRRMTVPVVPPFSVDPSAGAVELTSVQPGTRLHQAGLRPGDRVFNGRLLRNPKQAWIVFHRGERFAGVLLP